MTPPKMQDIVPPGKRKTAEVIHFELTDADIGLSNLRALRDGAGFMVVRPGHYVKLVADGALQMSDTDMEWRTNMTLLVEARGDILVAGLGIGFVLPALIDNKRVTSITVIERNKDVIALVAPHFRSSKLRIVKGDAKTPDKALNGDKFDVVWLDIWSTFCGDNLKEMASLKKQYRKRVRRGGFIGCWSEVETKSLTRRGVL